MRLYAAAVDLRHFLYGVLGVALVFHVHASDFYKCTSAAGVTTYSDTPCGKDQKVLTIDSSGSSSPSSRWKFSKRLDDMTGKVTCVADSPDVYLGSDNAKSFYFAKLRVLITDGQTGVAIEGTEAFKNHGDSIHTDVSNLGLKIGDRFFPVLKKINSSMAMLNPSDSQQIVSLLSENKPFRIRLRFWPYDTVYDNKAPREQSGFAAVFDQVEKCN